MDGIVAGPADPEGSGDQVFFGEQFLEAFLAVQVFGDQVVAGEFGYRAIAEFAVVGLRWELEHGDCLKVGSDEGFHLTPGSTSGFDQPRVISSMHQGIKLPAVGPHIRVVVTQLVEQLDQGGLGHFVLVFAVYPHQADQQVHRLGVVLL